MLQIHQRVGGSIAASEIATLQHAQEPRDVTVTFISSCGSKEKLESFKTLVLNPESLLILNGWRWYRRIRSVHGQKNGQRIEGTWFQANVADTLLQQAKTIGNRNRLSA